MTSSDNVVAKFNDLEFHKIYITEIQSKKNVLFTNEMRQTRIKNVFWLPETLIKKKKELLSEDNNI